MWCLLHRAISSVDVTTNNDRISESSSVHIQDLIDQTNSLLNEVIHANLTLSTEAVQEIKRLNKDKHFIQKDIKDVLEELRHTEDNYARCINEKYKLSAELDGCKNIVSSAEQVSDPTPHVSLKETASRAHADGAEKWLVVGMPTVSRLHGEEYLLSALEMLAQQLPDDPADLLYGRVLVNVVNVQLNTADRDKPHSVFEKARRLYAAPHPKAVHFEFGDITAEEILPDPVPGATAQNDKGNANKPGYLVRRQTRNIVSVMRRSLRRAQHYLFLEDDMQLCPNGLLAMQYLLAKASRYHPNWLAIRASYGMNGIFMHSGDLAPFADYLVKHQARRPPDHLVVEWYAGESPESKAYRGERANLGFKFNLFDHIGLVSTLRAQHSGAFPRCYELIVEPTVFQVEAFSPAQCPHDDLWPCRVARPDRFLVDWAKQQHHQSG